jgi:serine/threonine protein kinase
MDELGKGKFGIVYKAKTRDGFLVAIKYDITDMSVLKHEVTMLNYLHQRKCNSKNIPKIIWYGQSEIPNESPTKMYSCLVLPYYDCSLKQIMKQTSRTDIPSLPLKSWMSQMLHIIQSIHQLYVIHRDLKPDNFMIKDSQIYLIDFGISTFFIHGETGTHVPKNQESNQEIIGSPIYASIHIHEGHKSSRRDDCIQLGYVFLYMILGGHLPWEGIQCSDNTYSASHILYPANQERYKQKKNLLFDGLRASVPFSLSTTNTEGDLRSPEEFGLPFLVDYETNEVYKFILDCYELEYESKPSYLLH